MRQTPLTSYLKGFLVGLLTILIVSIVILSWVPPVSRDALTHHLAVPKLYLQHGGIYEIPSIKFSYYPMNLDLLYLVPLYFGNDIFAKFIHFAFALLTAAIIYGYLKKRLNSIYALTGAIFFLSLPIIVKLSITVYVDLGLVFFCFVSIVSLLNWIESRFRIKFLLISAVCCGLALGTKYNGLIVFFILTVLVPLVYMRQTKIETASQKPIRKESSINHQFKGIGFGFIFFLVALVVFSPWMIRNYIWKENPVYPLYNSLFNSLKAASADASDGGQESSPSDNGGHTFQRSSNKWGPFAIRKVIYDESWWEIALIPVRIFFQGKDDSPKYFDGKLNPFLFLLPFFAFFQPKNTPQGLRIEKKILVFFTVLYIIYAFAKTDMRIRYIAPTVPPLVILAVFGLHKIASLATHRWPNAPGWMLPCGLAVSAALILSPNASYIIKQFNYVKPFSYMKGRINRDTYIAKYRPEYSVIRYANRHLPKTAKILGFFIGKRRYYSDRELTFEMKLFQEIVNEADSAEIILSKLQDKGFTHFLIRYDLFNQWTNNQFEASRKKMLEIFFVQQTRHLLSKGGYGLYALGRSQRLGLKQGTNFWRKLTFEGIF